jgi:organic hydroperoxide reductase OsmC/OhrA
MLLASLSECHLLSYLHACVEAGVIVRDYTDKAVGIMFEDGKGGGKFTEVILRPHVIIAEESMKDAAMRAHHQAHEWCFIASSVNFPVRVEPTVRVA